jgi:hypothetical protein
MMVLGVVIEVAEDGSVILFVSNSVIVEFLSFGKVLENVSVSDDVIAGDFVKKIEAVNPRVIKEQLIPDKYRIVVNKMITFDLFI